MLVRERMKPAVFLEPDETLATAARKLRKDNIGCLPVCQDGRLLGMITDRDIAMRGVADNRDPNHMRVRDAMSVDAICCLKEQFGRRSGHAHASGACTTTCGCQR